jgi:tryptophanyl-tRNA synthetase
MSKKRALSGIKPTGFPHIGNYAGMLLPMLELSRDTKFDVNIFIADYHSLNDANARKNLGGLSLELAATLLALGFDPKGCTFYRQSDVPETFELTSFLTNFTPKGLMNRSHAYKAARESNRNLKKLIFGQDVSSITDFKILLETKGLSGSFSEKDIIGLIDLIEDADIGINMGLYNYPILMSADILLFDADVVPVGRDQRQHIEIARDIATSVNAFYGADVLKLPEGIISADTMEIPGIDGRKMSKSYGNQLPIFAEPAEVEKLVKRIKTDSKLPAEPKDEDNLLLKFHKAMATAEEHAAFRARFLPGGMGYGDAKKEVIAAHEAKFGKAREEYKRLMADPAYVNSVLAMGAQKARDIAVPVLKRVRKAAGFN